MNNNGHIKIHRGIFNWEWYKNSGVKVLFIDLLLRANWEDGKFEGQIIKRGELITSIQHLAYNIGMSKTSVKYNLQKLQDTGEVKLETTNKYTKITIINYNQYQDLPSEKQIEKQVTVKEPKEKISKESFIVKVKEQILAKEINSQEEFTAWYFGMLDEMGLKVPSSAAKVDWACSKDIWEYHSDVNTLKIACYEYVFNTAIRSNCASTFIKKNHSEFQLQLKSLLWHLRKNKIVTSPDYVKVDRKQEDIENQQRIEKEAKDFLL